jgi:hypothetical protein
MSPLLSHAWVKHCNEEATPGLKESGKNKAFIEHLNVLHEQYQYFTGGDPRQRQQLVTTRRG